MTLESPLHKVIKKKIHEIESAIDVASAAEMPVAERNLLSVMSGTCGEILYFFYMAKMKDSTVLYDRAFTLLEYTLDAIEQTGITSLTYCNGLAGFGVLFQLLVKEGFIETDIDDIMLVLDELLVKHTRAQLEAEDLDFLHGAIGDGFYLLSRLGTPATDECLSQLLNHLTSSAIRDSQGVRWHDQPSVYNSFASDVVNLSLSHGLSSKLVFLAQCIKAKVDIAECTFLLSEGIRYLQRQQSMLRQGDEYPSLIRGGDNPYYSDRLAWCYGDLCVTTALLTAGKVIGNTSWIEQALQLALRAAKRITSEETGLVDAGFCHGTAGVAHIFNRLYFESGIIDFQMARDYWIKQTLDKATFHDGLAGYKAYQGKQWHSDRYLLEGVMGINLVLQSSLEKDASNLSWDTLFLLNFSSNQ